MTQVHERFRQVADESTASELRNVLVLLVNLRYDEDEVQAMLVALDELRDTPVYRAIARMGLEEGRLTQTRRLVFDLGTEKLGEPDATTATAIAGVEDVDELERLLRRLLTVETWQELLATEP
jgi:predicted transposase YdaD